MFGLLERALGSCHPPGPLIEERDGTAGSDYEVGREYNQPRRPAEASITDPLNSRSTSLPTPRHSTRLWATARAEPQQPPRRTAPPGSAGASPARPAPLARPGARTGGLTSPQAQRLTTVPPSVTYPRDPRATH